MKQNIYDIKTFSEAYDKMRYENKGKNAIVFKKKLKNFYN